MKSVLTKKLSLATAALNIHVTQSHKDDYLFHVVIEHVATGSGVEDCWNEDAIRELAHALLRLAGPDVAALQELISKAPPVKPL